MRLWHYKLIPFLPNSQLVAQWRELNSIFKKQDNHILINYVYEYPKENLMYYSELVVREMCKRGYKISSMENVASYFQGIKYTQMDNPFPQIHNNRYLLQCYINLQEKYDRGQKDFTIEKYQKLEEFVEGELKLL